jgi:hypothetical protein
LTLNGGLFYEMFTSSRDNSLVLTRLSKQKDYNDKRNGKAD